MLQYPANLTPCGDTTNLTASTVCVNGGVCATTGWCDCGVNTLLNPLDGCRSSYYDQSPTFLGAFWGGSVALYGAIVCTVVARCCYTARRQRLSHALRRCAPLDWVGYAIIACALLLIVAASLFLARSRAAEQIVVTIALGMLAEANLVIGYAWISLILSAKKLNTSWQRGRWNRIRVSILSVCTAALAFTTAFNIARQLIELNPTSALLISTVGSLVGGVLPYLFYAGLAFRCLLWINQSIRDHPESRALLRLRKATIAALTLNLVVIATFAISVFTGTFPPELFDVITLREIFVRLTCLGDLALYSAFYYTFSHGGRIRTTSKRKLESSRATPSTDADTGAGTGAKSKGTGDSVSTPSTVSTEAASIPKVNS
jgi:multisubunit Na+/H+ antiporter MnhB subunit